MQLSAAGFSFSGIRTPRYYSKLSLLYHVLRITNPTDIADLVNFPFTVLGASSFALLLIRVDIESVIHPSLLVALSSRLKMSLSNPHLQFYILFICALSRQI